MWFLCTERRVFLMFLRDNGKPYVVLLWFVKSNPKSDVGRVEDPLTIIKRLTSDWTAWWN